MIGIDLFAGAGGMSLGAENAGIDVQIAVEIDSKAATTFSVNHPFVQLYNSPIQEFNPRRIPRSTEELIVFGGPPCRGFSTSNQRTRTKKNPSNWLFREFIRVVRSVEPDWVVVENVAGMLQTEGGAFVESIVSDLQEIGFDVSMKVLNSADFGVPQRRSRLFIVGAPPGRSFAFPTPTVQFPTSVWEAIGDLPVLQNGAKSGRMPYRAEPKSIYAKGLRRDMPDCAGHWVTNNAPYVLKRYREVSQGSNWRDIPARMMANYADATNCHTGIYHRLRACEPAKVIGNFRKNMLIHPYQHRGLSIREAARLQSFPDWFEFSGSIGFQQQQVGNAVPPLLAEALFSAILGR